LELSDTDVSRPYIEAAASEHPSLIDATHQMDALFGVVNIPNVIWIDEGGTIVRPPEPGWPGPSRLPDGLMKIAKRNAEMAADQRAKREDSPGQPERKGISQLLGGGQDRGTYPDAIRDWAANGSTSRFALTPDDVVARSQPRPKSMSEGAAHFELANHLWRAGSRDAAIPHFDACHRLQPENWTYKRQAWSLVGNERVGGEFGRFTQAPLPGEESDWPFASDFAQDTAKLEPGQYYPKTM
jgi:hypothetical protein